MFPVACERFDPESAMMQTSERYAATAESIGKFIRTILEARRPKVRYVFTPRRLMN